MTSLPVGYRFLVTAVFFVLQTCLVGSIECNGRQKIGVPAYYDPYMKNMWNRTVNGADLVIINPLNGPGPKKDPSYTKLVSHAQSSGITVMGYVFTRYGERSTAILKRSIKDYFDWYGVDGIFFDEGSELCKHVPYYQKLVAYTNSMNENAITALNWGLQGPECYFIHPNAPGVVVNFENPFPSYMSWKGPAQWVYNYPASRFWHLILAAPPKINAFRKAIKNSKDWHAGVVYVTDDTLNNPWDRLPREVLWKFEVSEADSCLLP